MNTAAQPTTTVTVDPARENSENEGSPPHEDGSEPAKDADMRFVEAWSDCELTLRLGTVLTVDDDRCPVVTEQSGQIEVDYQYHEGETRAELRVPSDAFTAVWQDTAQPTAEQCRKHIGTSGDRGGRVYVGEQVDGEGACIRTASGDHYLYLRFTEAVFHDDREFEITTKATAWDVVDA